MEKKLTSINRKWMMMSMLWSFLGCSILLLILNHQTHQNPSFLGPLLELYLPTTTNNLQQTSKKIMPTTKKCNIFQGRWVYDPKQTLSYNATKCGDIVSQCYRCQENGRPEYEYEKWRWEPTHCHIPLFNGKDMLERLRNKRMVLVGDSINKNQWQSLACLLYSSINDPSRVELRSEFLRAKDYNFTLEFHWSAFLVELNITHESGRKVLVLDKISDISKKWRGADIMVFNAAHWWNHPDKLKAWDVFEYKGKLIEEMPRELAFKRGLKTWARWMKNNVDPKQTSVFFRSNSEVHYSSYHCYNNTQLVTDIDTYKSNFPKLFTEIIEKLINFGMGRLQVKYLNITKLTQYRSDAHQSIYTSLQQKKGSKAADCSHWCLPGVPDTWNRLLYASLFFDISENL